MYDGYSIPIGRAYPLVLLDVRSLALDLRRGDLSQLGCHGNQPRPHTGDIHTHNDDASDISPNGFLASDNYSREKSSPWQNVKGFRGGQQGGIRYNKSDNQGSLTNGCWAREWRENHPCSSPPILRSGTSHKALRGATLIGPATFVWSCWPETSILEITPDLATTSTCASKDSEEPERHRDHGTQWGRESQKWLLFLHD